MKRLSLGLPSLVGAKRLLIVSQLSVSMLCTLLKSHQCFHWKGILKPCTGISRSWNILISRNVINIFKKMIMKCALILKRQIASNTVSFWGLSLSWAAQCIGKEISLKKSSAQGCAYPGFLRQHLTWIASIIKNGISLIISPSEWSINHKVPLNHAADGDDGKLMLRNYAKRHTSWSGLKAEAHKPCSCFICLPSLWGCTLKASLVPARQNWKQCHIFTKACCALKKMR